MRMTLEERETLRSTPTHSFLSLYVENVKGNGCKYTAIVPDETARKILQLLLETSEHLVRPDDNDW